MKYLGRFIAFVSPLFFLMVFLQAGSYYDFGKLHDFSMSFLYFYEVLHWLFIPLFTLMIFAIVYTDVRVTEEMKKQLERYNKIHYQIIRAVWLVIGICSYTVLGDISLSFVILFSSLTGFVSISLLEEKVKNEK